MYLHDQLVHKTIIEGCTGSRNHCTGFPDAPHRNLEKTALSEWNIHRTERILFARKKRSEGYTVNDIALLLHSSVTTINRYLSMPEDKIPEKKENARERQHQEQILKKQAKIDEVRRLHSKGHSIDEISRITGHARRTVKTYLKETVRS